MNYYDGEKGRDTLLILLLIISLVVIFVIILNNSKKINNLENDLETLKIKERNLEIENNSLKEGINPTSYNETTDIVEFDNYDNEQNNNIQSETVDSFKYTDKDLKVINYLESVEEKSEKLKAGNESKAKGVFIGLVDFLFYDGKINGVRYSELSDSGKKKVLGISSSIDTKLETKFPNYKEHISKKSKEAFNRASVVIKSGANKLSNFSKEKLGSENYNSIMSSKKDLIEYTIEATSIIGETTGKITANLKDKIKNWYENFKL